MKIYHIENFMTQKKQLQQNTHYIMDFKILDSVKLNKNNVQLIRKNLQNEISDYDSTKDFPACKLEPEFILSENRNNEKYYYLIGKQPCFKIHYFVYNQKNNAPVLEKIIDCSPDLFQQLQGLFFLKSKGYIF